MPFIDPQVLVAERARSGLTQAELADMACISSATISRIERHGRPWVEAVTLGRLAKALNIPVMQLIHANQGEGRIRARRAVKEKGRSLAEATRIGRDRALAGSKRAARLRREHEGIFDSDVPAEFPVEDCERERIAGDVQQGDAQEAQKQRAGPSPKDAKT